MRAVAVVGKVLLVVALPSVVVAFLESLPQRQQQLPETCHRYAATTSVEFQSDSSRFGRGEMHLSADLEEGDVVAYQTGSWLVDGVLVGEDKEPSLSYGVVETIQVVWTHNCEHGVLRGWELNETHDDDTNEWFVTGNMVEWGPEQLIARIPATVTADDDPFAEGTVYALAADLEVSPEWMQQVE